VKDEAAIQTEIRKLFASQKFAVLSTQEQEHPYLSLVAFAETADLKLILFATPRTTRKYGNIIAKSGVALLVDNRSNEVADKSQAIAVTIIGRAREVADSERQALSKVYLEKHPDMKGFLASPSTALIIADVDSYIVVSRFEQVSTLDLKS
jgi:nitroimidazol reductase NimA-like FMN-containing flavoprotein (pyridoxamine 5'-phosphate oxidase superfamily)